MEAEQGQGDDDVFAGRASQLSTRLLILEAALASIHRACECTFDDPRLLFGTLCRVSTLTRQALPDSPERRRERTVLP